MAAPQRKTKAIAEFGDFQTPPDLALSATKALVRLGIKPASIIEPTCGRGAFVNAALISFPEADKIIGVDINQSHLAAAEEAVKLVGSCSKVDLRNGNFFEISWREIIDGRQGPWLILGNPPWVTSSELSTLNSVNLPEKSNFHGRVGIEAITGKSNFDISEWMLLRSLDWLEGLTGAIAVLCKTAVARKILLHMWKKKYPFRTASMFKINALRHFSAAVDACFFVIETDPKAHCTDCDIYDDIDAEKPSNKIGYRDGHIVLNVLDFSRHRFLLEAEKHYVWRSGIKHDCSKVMELGISGNGLINGLGEAVVLEDSFLYPMLKSSDIANGRDQCRAFMLVTQERVGQETNRIQGEAPKTWEYLENHSAYLDKRGSVIYKNKPKYSVFGVGPYSFAPWKIAISGFYKKLQFTKIGPVDGKPVVFDDTIYFLPCWSEEEANFLEKILGSEDAVMFFNSMIHWDEKRPITVDILKRLSISNLARALGLEEDYARFAQKSEKVLQRVLV